MLTPKKDVNGELVFVEKDGKKFQVMLDADGQEHLQEVATEPKSEPKPTDQYMTKQQVDDLLAKVRKEEKDKLYPQIESLKDKMATQEQLIQALQKQLESGETSAGKEKSKVVEENAQLNSTIAALQDSINKLQSEIGNVRSEAAEKERILKLDNYRTKKLAEAGRDIIPELVIGNSEAEIDQNIANAKARFKELFKGVKSAEDAARQDAVNNAVVTGPTNPAPEPTQPDVDPSAIRYMSRDELDATKRKLGIPLNLAPESSIAGKRGTH